MKNLSFYALIFLILVSCSNDGSDTSTVNPEVTIKGYKITSISTYSDASRPTTKIETTGNLQDGKLFSETYENFSGGVSQGAPVTVQYYFYEKNLLSSVVFDDDTKSFYYDNQKNLIGVERKSSKGSISYRYVHQTNNVVFCERLNLPYSNPSAQVINRNIIVFDQNSNVVNAGSDNDLNGKMDKQYQYFYTNDNLTSILTPDGSIKTFEYSNVIDNFSFLRRSSYGEKVEGLLNSEAYAYCKDGLDKLSRNLSKEDLLNETYQVSDGNYYKKKTLAKYSEFYKVTNITTTEFFFN